MKPDLIAELTKNLQPVRPLASNLKRFVLSLGGLVLFLLLFAVLVGAALRPGWLGDALHYSSYAAEIIFGIVAVFVSTMVVVKLAVPSSFSFSKKILWALLPLLILVFSVVWRLVAPEMDSADPASPTKWYRPYCVFEVTVFALLSIAALFWSLRRAMSLRPGLTGMFVGIAAAMPPAIFMHVACFHGAEHVLKFHLGPVFVAAVLGFFLGKFFLKK